MSSGCDIVGGYPRVHLSFGQIQVSIENFDINYLATWSIFRGLGAVENHFFEPLSGWDIVGGYPRGNLSFGQIQVSIENFATDNLATWSISRGLGAMENHFFDPLPGWDIVGGYPRGHLSFGQIQVSIENFEINYLATWSIFRGLGALENHFSDPPSGW